MGKQDDAAEIPGSVYPIIFSAPLNPPASHSVGPIRPLVFASDKFQIPCLSIYTLVWDFVKHLPIDLPTCILPAFCVVLSNLSCPRAQHESGISETHIGSHQCVESIHCEQHEMM